MPRQKPEYIQFVKVQWGNHSVVKSLIEHIEAIELELKIAKEDEEEAVRKYGEAELNIVRLTENVAQLHAAWLELEKQVPKKVVLPKEVAEAIEFYEVSLQEPNTLFDIKRIEYLAGIHGNKHAKALNEYIFNAGYNTYFPAIIYGYTVEQTKEERLIEGLDKAYKEWEDAPLTPDAKGDYAELLQRLADFVTKFNAKN